MKFNRNYYYLFLLLGFGACKQPEESLFRLLPASESGIDFQNTVTESDSLNILDYLYFYNGGGVAMGDINNDGLADLFFSSNQLKNKLYLNKGNLKFDDISSSAKVEGQSSWNTGAIMVDINGDGWLDIYVTAVVGINGFEGHNELFINNKDNTFTESSQKYGLDFQCYSTSAAFLDYDLDGDLDLYLLNHAVHTQESFGRAQIRNDRNEKTGDKLLRNDGAAFTDVSEEAGIYGGINGYGLGISVADFNKDGYPDIYVGNDFHEDDYYYLNNGDGTFTESLKTYFGHISRFSMGNDAADINHDGWPDLISLDMLAQDDAVIKSSEGDDMYQTLKMRTEQYGYHYQYSRNMLFTSQPGMPYLETALLSGVAATDWSWSALFADYDLDGEKDLFISNGIPKRPNNLDYIKFISNDEIQRKLIDGRLMDQEALEMMPSGKVANYFFKGDGNSHFMDVSSQWSTSVPSISGASAMGDLDNDGDLDIVTNNIDEPVSIYINQSKGNSLEITLSYKDKNPLGIGAKVYAYTQGKLHYQELYTVRGFQASSQPLIHFGLGTATLMDSLKIVWPDRSEQKLVNVKANELLKVSYNPTDTWVQEATTKKTLFARVTNNLGIQYEHREDHHTDFNYQKLIPYEVSDRGPAFAYGDLDGDGAKDLVFGGARNQQAEIYRATEAGFKKFESLALAQDSLYEDTAAEIIRDQASNRSSLLLGSGGNVVSPSLSILEDRNYTLSNSNLQKTSLPEHFVNTGVIKTNGEFTFVGNYSAPVNFGKIVPSYLMKNNAVVQTFEDLGMVTDALWDDFDKDGLKDLIIIGEWIAPKFFKNENGQFKEVNAVDAPLNGLWQTIIPFDIDQDGDMDYLLGNWGLNSKFSASAGHPMKMYYSDFDQNGSTETILATFQKDTYRPLLGLDELSGQMVFLRKKFNSYKEFAGKSIEEVMGETLKNAEVFEIHTLASGFLRNESNRFHFVPFSSELQIAPIKAFTAFDFDGNGTQEVLAAGNYFGVIPFHGRFDSFPGAMIHSEKNVQLGSTLGLHLAQKSVRRLEIIQQNNKPYLLIIYNNDKAEVYEFNQ